MPRIRFWHNFLSWIGFLLTWFFSKPGRHLVCWIGAVCLGSHILFTAWQVNGHVTCDFAGQWLMGRMFFKGLPQELYLTAPQRKILAEGYKVGDPALHQLVVDLPDETARKALQDKLDDHWTKMIRDILEKNHSGFVVEGALYPPTAGLLFWPFSLMTPQASHAVIVFVHFLLAILNGWFISRITRHRLQWGEAVLLIFAFPNCFQAFLLGQNSMFSLFFLCAGWYCLHRGWPLCGGLVWAAFAYKPVFALSLLLVPVLLPNRRMLVGMVFGGMVYCLATLPFVGTVGMDRLVKRLWQGKVDNPATDEVLTEFQKKTADQAPPHDMPPSVAARMNPWERWLLVGKNAGHIYSYDANWVWMSRDLVGLPRRKMWDSESLWHTWRYVFERYVQGRDTWYNPWQEWQEERDRKALELWPEARREAEPEEFRQWLQEIDQELRQRWEAWEGAKYKDWEAHLQKTYDPSKGSPEEADRATLAGGILLLGFLSFTTLIGALTCFLPWWRGQPPPPQAEGNRAAFLLIGGIMGCWHFMHYDLILLVLPVSLMLGELTERSWPRFPGPVLALAILVVAPFVLWVLVIPGIGGARLPSGPWVQGALVAVQLGVGAVSLVMLLLTRRASWLISGTVAAVLLITEAVGFVGMQFGTWPRDTTILALEAAAILLPLAVMLPLLGGRLWLILLTALFLLCNWDMTYGNGITRFPFEIFLALILWAWAGILALREMRQSLLLETIPSVAEETTAQPFANLELIS